MIVYYVSYKGSTYQLRELTSEEDIIKSYKLRHEVFCSELKWVNSFKMEIDKFDELATYLGIFTMDNILVGVVRFVNSVHTMMIEEDFRYLLPDNFRFLKTQEVVEISRLAIKKEYRSSKYLILNLMHNFIYQWFRKNRINYSYAVVTRQHFELLRKNGFDCKKIGFEVKNIVACLITWSDFRKNYCNYIEFDKIFPLLPNHIKKNLYI